MAVQCPACSGMGHYPWDCGTSKQLTEAARINGVSWEFGALKGAAYYEVWENGNGDIVMEHKLR